MSDLEFRVLALLRDGAKMKASALTERLSPTNSDGEIHLALTHLQSQGLLTIDMGGNVKITGTGLSALLQLEEAKRKEEAQRKENQAKEEAAESIRLKERAQDKAEAKSEKKHDRAFEVFMFLLGLLLGAVIDHFGVVVSFVRGLFH